MKYLLHGNESPERVCLIICATKITSEPLITALVQHLSFGKPEKSAAILNGIPQQNLSRAMITMNEAADIIEKVKVLDWAHIKKTEAVDAIDLKLFENTIISTDGAITSIDCNKGLWGVSGTNTTVVMREALHYFQQYLSDGEYD